MCIAGCVPSPLWFKALSKLRLRACGGCGKHNDMKHDEYINEWLQSVAWATTHWKSLWGGSSPVNKPKGATQTLALARQQLAQARASALPEACPSHLGERGAAAGDSHETSSAFGQQMK